MTKKNYSEKEKDAFRKYADNHAPKRNMLKDCTCAFLVGGTICLLGQGLFDLYSKLQITEDTAKSHFDRFWSI